MSVENDNVEPVTDLRLALGNSSQYIQRRFNDDSGAGANAGLKIDMKYVATDPLSELVWSPQNGLSLKCADCSLADRKPTLFWGAGPSNMVLSPSGNMTSNTDNPINEEKFITVQDALDDVKSEMAGRDTSTRSPGNNTEVMPICGSSRDDRTVVHRPDSAPNEPLSGDPTGGGREVGSGSQTSRMEIVLASEVHHTKECEANDTPVEKLTSPGRKHEKSASSLKKESKSKRERANSLSFQPLEKQESTSEKPLQTLFIENACGAESKIVASDNEGENDLHQDKEMLPKNKTVSVKHSPTNSRVKYRRKGKQKALSDGDFNGRMSIEDDDSHESVESCNSTGLFPASKRRRSVEQQLIVESKRCKNQIEESPGSTSLVKQDSSFMNWISNMVKGLPKSNQNEAPPSLALTLAHPDHGHESPKQKLITYNKSGDSGCRNMGFQSIFQSLYCPKKKVQDYQTEPELANRLCHISATPIACHGDNEQFLLSNEKFNKSTSGNEAGPATQHKISSSNNVSSQENNKANVAENRNSFSLGTGKRKGETDSSSSIVKRKTSTTENFVSEPPSEVKTTHNLGHGSDPLGSLWITRFTPKASFPLLNLDYQNQSSGPALETTSFQRLLSCSQNHVGSSNDLRIMDAGPNSTEDPLFGVGEKSQNCVAETEASSDYNRTKDHNDQKSIYNLKPILPSPRFTNSEAMASVFARRLDALKHIMASDTTDNAACPTITCFFCGRKGHHLRDCSEITDGELEDLLRNANSYSGAEEFPCLCIRCFQLNHWAVACPNGSSRAQTQSGCGASSNNNGSPSEKHMHTRNEETTKPLDGKKSLLQAAALQAVDPRIKTGAEINLELNEVPNSDRMLCNANSVKDYVASSSGLKRLKENQNLLSSNHANRQISVVPYGIFDLIRRLRLSRTDILKWTNSPNKPYAHLNGFFLRLRLGKWEEGLGGTGYYVACITGEHKDSSPQNSKTSISVNVGGIKCLVKSQYVSNHDFHEDELTAWWSAMAKNGSQIPSEEELRLKIKERKLLGL